MDSKRCKTPEACSVETRRVEIDSETVRQRRRCNQDKDVAVVSLILELPLPLLYDILIRISGETVFKCRYVCKTFFNILTDPQFAQDHLSRVVTTTEKEAIVISNSHNVGDILLIYNHMSEPEKTSIVDHANSHCQTLSMPTSAPPIHLKACLVGSCNGLLCICYSGVDLIHTYYYICNPVLGEFLALPPHEMAYYHTPAFGCCPKTKQYKVILFSRSSLSKIHTLGTDCWREIADYIPNNAYYYGSHDQSFGGFLHWIVDHFTVSEMICAFNLETEQTSFLPTPSHFTHDTLPKLSRFQTGTLGGSFCLIYHHDTTLEICVMEIYGVKESWSKAFSIDYGSSFGPREWFYVCEYKFINGYLFFSSQSSVACYNLEKGTMTTLLDNDVRFAQVRLFRPSFISLKDITICSGGNVELVEQKMRHINWPAKGFPFIP